MGVSDVKYLNPPSPPACHLDFMSLVSRRFISSVHEWTNWCSFILTVKNVEILQNSISWKRHSLFSWCSRIQKWLWQHDCLLPGLKEVILNEVGVCCSRLECNMWALPMIKKQKQKTVIGALQHPKTCVGKKTNTPETLTHLFIFLWSAHFQLFGFTKIRNLPFRSYQVQMLLNLYWTVPGDPCIFCAIWKVLNIRYTSSIHQAQSKNTIILS